MSVQSRYPTPMHDQRQFFDDLITEEWASYQNAAWDYARRFEVACLFRKLKPARILDIGCGCGFHDVELAQPAFVARVDAIDYSARSIEKANEAYPHAKVFRRVADLAADAVEPIYDLVVSFQVFEHLDDPDVYFEYCLKARAPGGAIAIVTPNRRRLDNRIREWKGEPPALIDPQHFHEYTRGELEAFGRRYGLSMVDSFGQGLQSLIYPRLTPTPPDRATRLGAWVPGIANVIGVVLA
jgi:2-polyprenyl-3-methyl-5-hydroxy-6-metoxy-1,4-benzoquinol methylase